MLHNVSCAFLPASGFYMHLHSRDRAVVHANSTAHSYSVQIIGGGTPLLSLNSVVEGLGTPYSTVSLSICSLQAVDMAPCRCRCSLTVAIAFKAAAYSRPSECNYGGVQCGDISTSALRDPGTTVKFGLLRNAEHIVIPQT